MIMSFGETWHTLLLTGQVQDFIPYFEQLLQADKHSPCVLCFLCNWNASCTTLLLFFIFVQRLEGMHLAELFFGCLHWPAWLDDARARRPRAIFTLTVSQGLGLQTHCVAKLNDMLSSDWSKAGTGHGSLERHVFVYKKL